MKHDAATRRIARGLKEDEMVHGPSPGRAMTERHTPGPWEIEMRSRAKYWREIIQRNNPDTADILYSELREITREHGVGKILFAIVDGVSAPTLLAERDAAIEESAGFENQVFDACMERDALRDMLTKLLEWAENEMLDVGQEPGDTPEEARVLLAGMEAK